MLATSATRPARLSETMRRAGQAREGEREEILTGAGQPGQRPPALRGRLVVGDVLKNAVGRDIPGVLVLVRLRSVKQCLRPR
ncbi:hypothetical protein M2182_002588 [Bradyrhizobium japonicum]|nr:hypothetical protein [Bradyrhizobium japonicum]